MALLQLVLAEASAKSAGSGRAALSSMMRATAWVELWVSMAARWFRAGGSARWGDGYTGEGVGLIMVMNG